MNDLTPEQIQELKRAPMSTDDMRRYFLKRLLGYCWFVPAKALVTMPKDLRIIFFMAGKMNEKASTYNRFENSYLSISKRLEMDESEFRQLIHEMSDMFGRNGRTWFIQPMFLKWCEDGGYNGVLKRND
jgi:hypothetical protein